MSAPSTSPDPRSIVTPEAFHVAPELLGLRLASPGRRLVAISLDLAVIAVVTVVTRNFALVLGAVVTVTLLRAASSRTAKGRSTSLNRARRLSIGCLGLGIGAFTMLIGAALFFEDDLEELANSALSVDFGPEGVILREPPTAEDLLEPRDVQAIRDGVSLYSTDEALDAYAELLRSGSDSETDRELRLALEARLSAEVAGDTLAALQGRIRGLEQQLQDEELRRAQIEARLEEGSSGIIDLLAGLLDDLGLGFGWAALYTTVLLTMTDGQTLGKRIMGLRVVRLDGEPITWWVGFERAGGYAAGFATGLLGFAQVYWDANRQGIHDRIVGTVVVREEPRATHDREGEP